VKKGGKAASRKRGRGGRMIQGWERRKEKTTHNRLEKLSTPCTYQKNKKDATGFPGFSPDPAQRREKRMGREKTKTRENAEGRLEASILGEIMRRIVFRGRNEKSVQPRRSHKGNQKGESPAQSTVAKKHLKRSSKTD